MNSMQELIDRIIAKSNQMALDAKETICGIPIHVKETTVTTSPKDVPSRPWMITGCACLATSVIGAMSCESKWPYFLGALGLASLGIGYTKINPAVASAKGSSLVYQNINDEKAFIIEKCNKILDKKKNEWDTFMDAIKEDVQTIIKQSPLSEDKKEEFLSYTYYPESLSLSTLSLIDKLDAINDTSFTSQILAKKSEFADEVAASIVNTSNLQIQMYNKIKI